MRDLTNRKWLDREVVDFSYKMSELMQSGLSLMDSLAIIANQFIGQRRKQILEIRERIMEGTSLIDAFRPYPFPYPFLVMLGIAQFHGRIADTFFTLGEWFERKIKFKKTILQKSLYPILLFLCSLALFIYFFIVLLPQFQNLLRDINELPLITSWLFQLRNTLQSKWLIIISVTACIMAALFLFFFYLHNKRKWYQFCVRIPIIRHVIKFQLTYLLSSQLGLLLQSGLGILEALQQIRAHFKNAELALYVKEIEDAILLGIPLSRVKLSITFLHNDFFQLIQIGEQTGTLADHLLLCSKLMEERIQTSIHRILRWIEPFMILSIGIIILFVVLSVFLPVIQMIQIL